MNPAKSFLFGSVEIFRMVGFDSQKESEIHNCLEVSEMSEIVRIVGWALAESRLAYNSLVVISIKATPNAVKNPAPKTKPLGSYESLFWPKFCKSEASLCSYKKSLRTK